MLPARPIGARYTWPAPHERGSIASVWWRAFPTLHLTAGTTLRTSAPEDACEGCNAKDGRPRQPSADG